MDYVRYSLFYHENSNMQLDEKDMVRSGSIP